MSQAGSLLVCLTESARKIKELQGAVIVRAESDFFCSFAHFCLFVAALSCYARSLGEVKALEEQDVVLLDEAMVAVRELLASESSTFSMLFLVNPLLEMLGELRDKS